MSDNSHMKAPIHEYLHAKIFRGDNPQICDQRDVRPQFLDGDFTLRVDGEMWQFQEGQVKLKGYLLTDILKIENLEIGQWLALAGGLYEYRKQVGRIARESQQYLWFEKVVENLLHQILKQLKKAYDQKMLGMEWSLETGRQLILNGINVRSFLALYKVRKTEKAKKYLRGLRARLEVLLMSRGDSPDSENMRELLEELHLEMLEILEREGESASACPTRLLLSAPAAVC
ncbi:MAG: hypothetical protein IPJ69_11330 [Deltaproteobacteria bacterium]|nr:MAG: hypothetical protein IPJ69_11330 [Deltaproteobacteria bacterium]